jgi:hypothetical protein
LREILKEIRLSIDEILKKTPLFLNLDEIAPKIFKRKELCRSPTKFNAKNLGCWRDRDGTILQNNFK